MNMIYMYVYQGRRWVINNGQNETINKSRTFICQQYMNAYNTSTIDNTIALLHWLKLAHVC